MDVDEERASSVLKTVSSSAEPKHLVLAVVCVVLFVVALYAGVSDGLLEAARDGLLEGVRYDCCQQPVSHGSLQASSQLGPRGDVLINVTIHCLVGLLVLFTTRRLIEVPLSPGPMVGAVTFVLVPIQVDTVAATFGRSELLAAAFGVLALTLHARGGLGGRLGALAAFLVGVLSSESALCMPVTWLAYDLAFRDTPTRRYAISYVGAVGLAIGYFVLIAGGASLSESHPLGAVAHAAKAHLVSVILPAQVGVFEPWGTRQAYIPILVGVLGITAAILVALRHWRGRRIKNRRARLVLVSGERCFGSGCVGLFRGVGEPGCVSTRRWFGYRACRGRARSLRTDVVGVAIRCGWDRYGLCCFFQLDLVGAGGRRPC